MSRSSNEPASELIRAQDLKGVDLWSMPSFDPERPEPEPEPELVEEIEEVPLDEVQPLTLEELESIRQEAYNEGFAVGEREGFHSTQLKVRQEAEVALGARLASLEALMQHLFVPIADQDSQIERSMVELVGHVAREVIQRELRTDSSQIETVLRESLKLLPMGANNVRIFVNPQDFAQIKAMRERQEENWRILEDIELQPGGCRVETEHSRIDASIETRITQALAQMFDQLHEQYLHPTESDIGLELADVEAQHVLEQTRLHAEAQARADAEAKVQAEARAKAQAEADAHATAEAEALAHAEQEAEAVAAARALAETQAQAAEAEHPPATDPLEAVRKTVEASDAP
jgi:flagellar assembly protein FliH